MINTRLSPTRPKYLSILTGAVICLVLIAGLQWGRPVFIPISIAVLLTLLLAPAVQRLERFGIPHIPSVLITVSLAALALGGLGWVLGAQVTSLLADLPKNTETIKAKIRSLRQLGSGATTQRLGQMVNEISDELEPESSPQKNKSDETTKPRTASGKPGTTPPAADTMTAWSLVTIYIGSVLEVLGSIAFAFVLIVFFLIEGREWRDRLVVLAGKAQLSVTTKALQDINDRITRYLGMVAVVNGGFGLLLSVGLFLLGMPYAILWGFVAGSLRFIPYIGPWMGAIFPITMSLALSQGWWQPFAVFAVVIVLELVSNNVVEPLVFGRTTGVSPTSLLISAGFWLYLWGPLGLVLSIPFAVCLVVIGKHVPQLSFLNLLLGDEPALSSDVSYYHRLMLGDPQEALAIVASHLQKPDSPNVYDELLIPALSYAKHDRIRNVITAEDYQSILEAIRSSLVQIDELVHASRDKATAMPANKDRQISGIQMKVMGHAADDDADKLALEILQFNLKARGHKIQVTNLEESNLALTTYIAEPPQKAEQPHTSVHSHTSVQSHRVARPQTVEPSSAVICIASIPPGGLDATRSLHQRIREAAPDALIIIGRWGNAGYSQNESETLASDENSLINTTQSETCTILTDHAAKQISKKP